LLAAALFATIGFFASSVVAQQAVPSGTIETFPAGENPWGLAFDGENVYVTNNSFDDSTVTKLRASDGALLGTFPLPGNGAAGITFDGENIWVANTLSVVRLAGGDPTQFYPVGDTPRGVLFDGTSIWVANNGSDTVTKITLNQP
jgi:DNA-binding beta-propeller fold protein YncE